MDPFKAVDAYDAFETIFLNGEPVARGSLLPANPGVARWSAYEWC